jgi:hypothetical protein
MRRSIILPLLLGVSACLSETDNELARVNRAIAAKAAACAADASVDMEACMSGGDYPGYPRIETPACPHGASREQLRDPHCWLGLVVVASRRKSDLAN